MSKNVYIPQKGSGKDGGFTQHEIEVQSLLSQMSNTLLRMEAHLRAMTEEEIECGDEDL